MNRLEVQKIYDTVSTPRSISAIEALGFKSCLSYDLSGSYLVENTSDADFYIDVKYKLQELCKYALNAKHEPVAKDYNGAYIYIGGTVWYDDEEYLVHAYKQTSNGDERILVTCCDGFDSPRWLYLGCNDVTVRNPNAQVVDPRSSLEDAASALRALQDYIQKDVFDRLETVLESLREAQKD